MAKQKKAQGVTATLATGTKVTASQEVIDKMKRQSGTSSSKTSK